MGISDTSAKFGSGPDVYHPPDMCLASDSNPRGSMQQACSTATSRVPSVVVCASVLDLFASHCVYVYSVALLAAAVVWSFCSFRLD